MGWDTKKKWLEADLANNEKTLETIESGNNPEGRELPERQNVEDRIAELTRRIDVVGKIIAAKSVEPRGRGDDDDEMEM